ncbi:preprotein translocase subunit SecG [Phyllobacterium chamaecytisi]|jgi:preprotein translocase subunit SecG|uniref:preprotein translocase subunit SecG n=1 Tax=Phyllobacterium chamaecytisi TaxID=2876082 RepID=UPI001CCC1798|nr:preprotein translocase subunit SecG [Phyllobacterium sp. KW56]MBZ9601727.1 preprotein translocase subunit SecG [Phyllobacterium sp. KW56]
MQTVVIVIHLLIVLALVGVVLMQRSEGGGLGIGGGSGFMTARGAANVLTRATAILATGFFITSLALGIMARYGENPTDILNRIPTTTGTQPAGQQPPTSGGILNQLGGPSSNNATPPASNEPAPGSAAPGTTAPAAPESTLPAPTAPVTPAQPANPVPNSQ